MITRTHYVFLCAGLWTVGCSGSTDSTATNSYGLKGGQSAQHQSDASEGHENASEGHENEGGVSNGTGNGVGMGTGDGVDCKPGDGGPSPCRRGDGGGSDKSDAAEHEDARDNDDGGKECKPPDGGPSPCSEGKQDH